MFFILPLVGRSICSFRHRGGNIWRQQKESSSKDSLFRRFSILERIFKDQSCKSRPTKTSVRRWRFWRNILELGQVGLYWASQMSRVSTFCYWQGHSSHKLSNYTNILIQYTFLLLLIRTVSESQSEFFLVLLTLVALIRRVLFSLPKVKVAVVSQKLFQLESIFNFLSENL